MPRTYLILPLTVVALLLCGSFFVSGSQTPRAVAEKIVAQCVQEGSDHAPCYESLVPALYPVLSIPEIFEVVRTIRTKDASYQFCHVLAHKLGERVVAEDPTRWMLALSQNPTGFCSSGFVHGVVGGRFRSEVLDDTTIKAFMPDFARACEPHDAWNPSEFEKAVCYHGMGHLYVFITDADLEKALQVCEATSLGPYRRLCIEGVFMQIYQPLEPDDFLLIENMDVRPSTTTVRQFCSTFEDPEYVGACQRESWPFFKEGVLNGTGAGAFCAGQPNEQEELRCFEAASGIVGRLSLGQENQALTACSAFPLERQALCFTSSAQAIVEESRQDSAAAVRLCQRAPSAVMGVCLSTLASRASFIYGQDRAGEQAFCAEFPEPYSQTCMQQNGL